MKMIGIMKKYGNEIQEAQHRTNKVSAQHDDLNQRILDWEIAA